MRLRRVRMSTIEEAWHEATEYLYENDYPAIIEGVRTFGLAVLEMVDAWLREPLSTKESLAERLTDIHQRIDALPPS